MSFPAAFDDPSLTPPDGTLLDLLVVEELEHDLFRAPFVTTEEINLYGGQVAAQALRAAGATVPPDRVPHSLHGYFLSAGDPGRPTTFLVHRDRDGGSFSARRVEARQEGGVIFSMSASFHARREGPDQQAAELPAVPSPEGSAAIGIPRLVSFEGRAVAQPCPDTPWPTRFWARCTLDLGDDALLQACALTYLSDLSSGVAPFTGPHGLPGPSLDHAVWFHRPFRMAQWHLVDMVPGSVAGGRGWYTGSLYAADGTLSASTTQECLFRRRD